MLSKNRSLRVTGCLLAMLLVASSAGYSLGYSQTLDTLTLVSPNKQEAGDFGFCVFGAGDVNIRNVNHRLILTNRERSEEVINCTK